MLQIVKCIRYDNVHIPITMLLDEYKRLGVEKCERRGIYHDLLFLTFTALGRENIDQGTITCNIKRDIYVGQVLLSALMFVSFAAVSRVIVTCLEVVCLHIQNITKVWHEYDFKSLKRNTVVHCRQCYNYVIKLKTVPSGADCRRLQEGK